jgi:hypothetical protein
VKATVLFVAGVVFVDVTPPSWATLLSVAVWLAVAARLGQLDVRRRRREARRALARWTIRSEYVRKVLADDPVAYWPLDELSGGRDLRPGGHHLEVSS